MSTEVGAQSLRLVDLRAGRLPAINFLHMVSCICDRSSLIAAPKVKSYRRISLLSTYHMFLYITIAWDHTAREYYQPLRPFPILNRDYGMHGNGLQ